MTGHRISVIGPAGSGKSTFADLVEEFAEERGLTHARVKLAAPLYALQQSVYATAGAPLLPGQQDQQLMESLAETLRRIRPESLAEDFMRRLAATDADIVVNDDLRDPHVDAVQLRRCGFIVVRVRTDPRVRSARLAARCDLTLADRSTRELELIEPDVVVANDGTLSLLRKTVRQLLGGWWA